MSKIEKHLSTSPKKALAAECPEAYPANVIL